MRRYFVIFAMLGFLGTVFFSFFNEAPLPEVLSSALFWALIAGLFGIAISFGTRRIVDEIPLPSATEEMDEERRERRFQDRMTGAAAAAASRPTKKTPEKPQDESALDRKSPDAGPASSRAADGGAKETEDAESTSRAEARSR